MEELDRPAQSHDLDLSNAFGMNWNADCEPDHLASVQDLAKAAAAAQWERIHAASFQNQEAWHQKSAGYCGG